MYRVLVAEDESILRNGLVNRLRCLWSEDIEIVEALSGIEASQLLDKFQPEVAFIDIQMGAVSGLDVISQYSRTCIFVLTTAYQEYAVKAFEYNVEDYLLKPYSDVRLLSCITKVKSALARNDIFSDLEANTNRPTDLFFNENKLKVRIGNKIWFLDIQDVIYFKSHGRYIKVKTREREGLIRCSLRSLHNYLDAKTFVQIRRSTLINLNFLDHIQVSSSDEFYVVLKYCDDKLLLSRQYRRMLNNC